MIFYIVPYLKKECNKISNTHTHTHTSVAILPLGVCFSQVPFLSLSLIWSICKITNIASQNLAKLR